MAKRKGAFTKVGENLYRYSSNKVYYAVFRSKGKLVWKSLRTDDKDLAKRRLKEEIAKQERIDPNAARMTLEAALTLYEENILKYEDKTTRTRQSILKTFRNTWRHGFDLPVREISTAQLELWLAGHQKRLKKSSYNEYVRFLHHLFDLAIKSRAITDSPAANLHGLKRERPIRETPTWEQFQEIVREIRSQRFSAEAQDTGDLVEFMGLAGVGTAECANLHGEHVNFTDNKIILYRQKTDTGYSIPIFPQVLPLLRKLHESGQIRNGKPIFKVKDPKKGLAAACRRLEVPNFSPRSLRCGFITRAIELGVDFKTIAAWQGHRDGGVLVAKTYSHLRSEHSDAMAKKIVAPA
jgi:site-specific recombinase XerD